MFSLPRNTFFLSRASGSEDVFMIKLTMYFLIPENNMEINQSDVWPCVALMLKRIIHSFSVSARSKPLVSATWNICCHNLTKKKPLSDTTLPGLIFYTFLVILISYLFSWRSIQGKWPPANTRECGRLPSAITNSMHSWLNRPGKKNFVYVIPQPG